MEGIMLAHEKAELEYDLDATMDTLVPNPHFELPPFGIAIDGWEGVRTMYSFMIQKGGRDRNLQAVARVIGEAPNTLMREAWISYDTIDGRRVTGGYMVVMSFEPETKKILGERMYADKIYADLLAELIGDTYLSWPGVSQMGDGAPIINRHDAFDLAASRGVVINNAAADLK
jgi:hypothetical protein